MNANERIEITQVSNGFIVNGCVSRDALCSISDTLVFQSFNELVDWLAEHFSHRKFVFSVDHQRLNSQDGGS